jgi:hypothetical protein
MKLITGFPHISFSTMSSKTATLSSCGLKHQGSISSTFYVQIFLYKRCFGSLESGFERNFGQKMRAKNIDEIDGSFLLLFANF